MEGTTWFTAEVDIHDEWTTTDTVMVSLNIAQAREIKWAAEKAFIAFPQWAATYVVSDLDALARLRSMVRVPAPMVAS